MTHSNQIFLIAGEASGDALGAELIPALQKLNSKPKLVAMGGPKLQAAGAELLLDSRHLAVVGLWEVITHARVLRKAFKQVTDYLKTQRPAVIILIDYPGFNLRIAKIAHELGIKVIFYVSPQIWAWRFHRIHHIKKYVDHMVVFFKFEEAIYQQAGVPVSLVAHPLLKLTQKKLDAEAFRARLSLNSKNPIIALLPGSRQQEIKKLFPLMMSCKKLIQQKIPEAQFVLPLASGLSILDIQSRPEDHLHITQDPAYEVLNISEAAIVASGTATLEAALMKTPLAIVYKVWGFSFAKRFIIKTPYIGLCNIAAQQVVAKEFIQDEAKPQLIAAEIVKLIKDVNYREQILQKLEHVRNQLGSEDAAGVIAGLC